MLIFDSFPSRDAAERFASATGLSATVHDSQEESNRIDLFPFVLHPPIVLVERAGDDEEHGLDLLVEAYNGKFAGT